MKKYITLALLALSFSAVANATAALKIFNCQFAETFCGVDGGRYTEAFKFRDRKSADLACEEKAKERGHFLCGVSLSETPGYRYSFRCQLAQDYCDLDGGRYTIGMLGQPNQNPEKLCRAYAEKLHNKYCRVYDLLPLKVQSGQ